MPSFKSTTSFGEVTCTNLAVNGLVETNTQPTVSQTLSTNHIARIHSLPYRLNAGIIITIQASAVLRIDA